MLCKGLTVLPTDWLVRQPTAVVGEIISLGVLTDMAAAEHKGGAQAPPDLKVLALRPCALLSTEQV